MQRSKNDLVGIRVAERSYGVIKQCHDFIELIIDVMRQSKQCQGISLADLWLLRSIQVMIYSILADPWSHISMQAVQVEA